MSIFSLLIMLFMAPVLAQDTITLKPYTDKSYGLTGVVPDGWNDIGSGLYERAQSPTDVTLILQQTMPVSADKVMASLLPRLGLTQAPESVGTYQSSIFNWTLYKVDFQTPTTTVVVDLAFAEDVASGKTIFVSLQTSADEYDTLHQAVFLPVLDALRPYAELPLLDDLIHWLRSSLSLLVALSPLHHASVK